ncbi:MAG: biopolymer transporter ExbD [Chthoniobacteraceae bacterium]
MRQLAVDPNEGTVGFQIAPMIDVVFVIMLFFMVMAGAVKVERELNCQLPGTVETAKEVPFADEQVVQITARGDILLNEEPMADASDKSLQTLRAVLMRVKANCDAAKTPAVVVLASEPKAKHGRAMDVLDALSEVGITSVSFNVTEEE